MKSKFLLVVIIVIIAIGIGVIAGYFFQRGTMKRPTNTNTTSLPNINSRQKEYTNIVGSLEKIEGRNLLINNQSVVVSDNTEIVKVKNEPPLPGEKASEETIDFSSLQAGDYLNVLVDEKNQAKKIQLITNN